MNLVRRFAPRLHSWLDKLFTPAEDPRQTFVNSFERQRGLLLKVQKALADIRLSKERLQANMLVVKGKLPGLEGQAKVALKEGREDLARLALQRHQIASEQLQVLDEQVQAVQQKEQELLLTEHRLSTQLDTFLANQEIDAARYGAAEAQRRIDKELGGVFQELADLGDALHEAEEKARAMHSRTIDIGRLIDDSVAELPGVPSGEQFLHGLGQTKLAQAVEEQLQALKQHNAP